MPWRLVSFILIVLVLLVFIFSNNGKSDISFLKWTLPQVPVWATVVCSFFAGLICSIPLIISAYFKAKKKFAGKDGPEKGKVPKEEPHALDEEP
jgi:uncharacterized integral membrane protein